MGSKSTSLLARKIALEGATEAGAKTELLNVRELDLPMFAPDADADRTPVSARLMSDAIYAAPGLIWASPHYHGTVSGSFKNALDWLQLLANRDPPFLMDKVIGLISTAGGVQGLQTINTMEYVVRALRAWAVPLVMPVAQAWQAFDESDRPRDQAVETQLRTLGSEVARGGATHDPGRSCGSCRGVRRGGGTSRRRSTARLAGRFVTASPPSRVQRQ